VTASATDVPTICGDVSGSGLKVAIVTARFNSLVTKALLEGCVETLLANGVASDVRLPNHL
jgi:6,7-dimethyl-8-ribityllumazine synthase